MSNDLNPHAINFKKFQRYDPAFFNLNEIIFFEYITFLHTRWKKQTFFHAMRIIIEESGLKRTVLESAIKKFTALGIMSVAIINRVSHFNIDYVCISGLLKKIFRNDVDQEENIKRWQEFHSRYFDNEEEI